MQMLRPLLLHYFYHKESVCIWMIYVQNFVRGSNQTQKPNFCFAFRPDSVKILFTGDRRGEGIDIHVISLTLLALASIQWKVNKQKICHHSSTFCFNIHSLNPHIIGWFSQILPKNTILYFLLIFFLSKKYYDKKI